MKEEFNQMYCKDIEHTDLEWDDITSEFYCNKCLKLKKMTP